jgi:hypothetical protein
MRAGLVALLVTLAAACGERSPVGDLAEIESGTLSLRLVSTATGEGSSGRPVGFEMTGPFSFRSGSVPVARLDHTRLMGTSSTRTTFTSTGERAFVTLAGETYELPPEQLDALRNEQSGGRRAGLEALAIEDWVREPKVSGGGRVDGVDTTRVTGRVNAGAALTDLVALARQLGPEAELEPLEREEARRLDALVKSSEIELLVGRQDRLLRRLRLVIDFGASLPDRVRASLGPYAGTRLEVDLGLSGPNRDVTVEAPAGAKPLSRLPPRP